jgi:hypothetical protein
MNKDVENYKKKFDSLVEYNQSKDGQMLQELNGDEKYKLVKNTYHPLENHFSYFWGKHLSRFDEAEIDKILGYHIEDDTRAFIVISAQRGSWTDDSPTMSSMYGNSQDLVNDKEINHKKTADLIHDLSHSQLSYIPVYGGFVENRGTPSQQVSFETSFMVFNIKGNKSRKFISVEELFDFGKELCDKYWQNTFLFKQGNQPPKFIDKDGNADKNATFTGEHQIDNYTANYFTQLKKIKTDGNADKFGGKNKRFTFTTPSENREFLGFYQNPSANNLHERRVRHHEGCEIYGLDNIYK